jgi:hypothetical protein
MEWDWRGHSAGTTFGEGIAQYPADIVLAFEGIFLGLDPDKVGSEIHSVLGSQRPLCGDGFLGKDGYTQRHWVRRQELDAREHQKYNPE